MARIETGIYIDAAPEDVFDFAAYNPERLPEWFEGVERVEASPGYPEVGTTVEVKYKTTGLTLTTTGTVVEMEPGRLWVADYEGMASGRQTWVYEPDGDGTYVSVVFDYEMAGGGLGKIVDKLVAERQNKNNFEQSLQNLKAMMEG